MPSQSTNTNYVNDLIEIFGVCYQITPSRFTLIKQTKVSLSQCIVSKRKPTNL